MAFQLFDDQQLQPFRDGEPGLSINLAFPRCLSEPRRPAGQGIATVLLRDSVSNPVSANGEFYP